MDKREEIAFNGNPFSEEKFEQLYRQYYLRLFNFTLQFTKDKIQSQDIVHEVFLKFWEKRFTIKDISIEALLFKMTRNLCLNYVKHLKVVSNQQVNLRETQKWEELYRIEFLKDEPYILIEHELEQSIRKIANELPTKCREVFELSRISGLKNHEIAQKLGISIKAVEKHLNRAFRDFRLKLPAYLPISIIILILLN